MATIRDVAREAGVSLGTVSKVINGLYVKEANKLRVEEAMEKLHYQANPNAQRLKAKLTGDIAVIVPTLQNPLFPALLDAIEDVLSRNGQRMLICISRDDPAKIRDYIAMSRNSRVDGIFGVSYTEIDPEIFESLPFVVFDRHLSPAIPCIASDNFAGGYLAARTLREKGAEKLLCIWTGVDEDAEPTKRIDGFKTYCEEHRVAYQILKYQVHNAKDTDYMYPSDSSNHTISDGLTSYISSKKGKPQFQYDGIFASSDHLALQVQDILEARGIRVPLDVQLIGFDGISTGGNGKPLVSSIRQPVELIAKTGLSMLQDLIQGKKPESNLSLPVAFLDGGTTR